MLSLSEPLQPSTTQQHSFRLYKCETVCQGQTSLLFLSEFRFSRSSLSLFLSPSLQPLLFPLLGLTCCLLWLSYLLALAISVSLSLGLPIQSLICTTLHLSNTLLPTDFWAHSQMQSHTHMCTRKHTRIHTHTPFRWCLVPIHPPTLCSRE